MTRSEFLILYPEFATVLAAKIDSALSISTRLLSATAWGDFIEDAIGLNTAHNLAIQDKIGTTPAGAFGVPPGPISSASAAGASASFAVATSTDTSHSGLWYNKTVYGQQFLALRAAVIPGMAITV